MPSPLSTPPAHQIGTSIIQWLKEQVEQLNAWQRNTGNVFLGLPGATGLQMTVGSATLVFSSSADSEVLTITHGLGRTPLVVLTAYGSAGNPGQLVTCWSNTYGESTFKAGAHSSTSASGSVTKGLQWAAIG